MYLPGSSRSCSWRFPLPPYTLSSGELLHSAQLTLTAPWLRLANWQSSGAGGRMCSVRAAEVTALQDGTSSASPSTYVAPEIRLVRLRGFGKAYSKPWTLSRAPRSNLARPHEHPTILPVSG
ncbi:hypothetical protein DPEC_G00261740 [Dallia pectoralis]|uniref:Uncharacterized protein n=1 Tax=Dallia pectoralis TaxID=75939 RepID=A0ACC2FRX5_DALPE|nr:hypothetical protein DPEC_G00261740 [Dallia pectoralis]